MGVPNFLTLMMGQAAGVQFTPVHFDGGAPSITALLGSHVVVLAGGTVDGIAYKRSGEFRVLGVSDEQRDWSMPDVPTMREQGYDVIAVSNTGMVGAGRHPGGGGRGAHQRDEDGDRQARAPGEAARHRADPGLPGSGRLQQGVGRQREPGVKPILATLRPRTSSRASEAPAMHSARLRELPRRAPSA